MLPQEGFPSRKIQIYARCTGSTVLGFRKLSYGMSSCKPVQNMNLTGPILTFNRRW
jgi:hypothetical protein